MITKNPWLGLASYEEPKNDGTDCQFCGRDEETIEMVRLIDNNLFITLYGCSGIGKTSLLRAGVIPILRRKDYFPLYVRLSEQPKDISYAEAIVRKLQNSNLTMEEGAAMKHADSNDRLFLWEYFATTHFLNEGREVYPVIILDQFEEVFREGDKGKAELLLKQIYLLINDELEMPDEAGWSADTNYRFVASIREDFLFVLEDSIDENSLDLYKNNRYRLRPMKPEQAQMVVLKPGKDCIEETEKDSVTERIIALSKRQQSNDIDTLMLSLVCASTYEKKSGEKIVLSDLAIWKNNPMEVYYKDAVKGLTANQIRYIQQHLIREDGSRRRVDAKEVESILGETTYFQLTQGMNRLLTIGDKGKVELLHDQLGMAVCEERKAFEEQERKKEQRRRLLTIIGLSLLFAILGLGVGGYSLKQKRRAENALTKEEMARLIAEKATEEKENTIKKLAEAIQEAEKQTKIAEDATKEKEKTIEELKEYNFRLVQLTEQLRNEKENVRIANWGKNETKAKIVAMNADELVGDDSYTASLAVLDVLPSESNPSFPFIPEVEYILRKANRIGGALLKGHTKDVTSVSFSPDGKYIASLSDDKTIRLWSTEKGMTERIFPLESSYGRSVCFSNNGESLMVYDGYSYDIIGLDGTKDNSIRNNRKAVSINRNEITLRNLSDYRDRKTLKGHTQRINTVKFSSDSTFVISSSQDSTVGIWRVHDGKRLGVINGNNVINDAAMSNDGSYIVSVSKDSIIQLWSVNSNNVDTMLISKEERYKVPDGYAEFVVYSPNNKFIAFTSYSNYPSDRALYLWNVDKHKVQKLGSVQGKTTAIAFSPDSKTLISPSNYNDIKLWKIQQTEASYSFDPLFTSKHHSSAVSSNGKFFVATEYSANNVAFYNTQTGTKNSIWSGIGQPVFHPDGNKIISLINNDIHLWDVGQQAKGQKIPIERSVSDYVIVNDKILTNNNDSTTTLWDLKTLKEIYTIDGHWSNYSNMMSPSSSSAINVLHGYLLTNNKDGYAYLNKFTTGEKEKKFGRMGYKTYSAILSPSGKYMASSFSDSISIIWNVKTGEKLKSFKTDLYTNFQFSSDDKFVVYLKNNSTVVMDLQDFSVVKELPKADYFFVISPSNKHIIMPVKSSKDKSDIDLKLYNIGNGQEQTLLTGSFVYYSRFSPDLKHVAVAADDTVKVYNTNNWNLENSLTIKRQEGSYGITNLDYSPDGESILIGDALLSMFTIWDLSSQTNNHIEKYEGVLYSNPLFSTNDSLLAFYSNDNTIHIIDPVKLQNVNEGSSSTLNQRRIVISDSRNQTNKKYTHYEFNHKGNSLLTISRDSLINIWSTRTGALVQTLNKNKGAYYIKATFDADDKFVFAGGSDSTICIWEVVSGKEIRKIYAHEGAVQLVKVSSDNRFMVSVSNYDKTLKVWSMLDYSLLRTIPLMSFVTDVSISSDNIYIVTTGNKETNIWDVDNGKLIESLEGRRHARFAKDGRHLIVYDTDNMDIYEFLPIGELIDNTRRRLRGRNLMPEEKEKLGLE